MSRPQAAICPGPVSRRSFLEIGSLAVGGLGLSDISRLRAMAGETGNTDTSVILFWLPGGASHLETFDMKPNAPSEIRGEMSPTRTNVPGIEVCELLPLHAKIADKFSLIRSISHGFSDHGGGHKKFLTGRDPRSPVGSVNDYPMVGSITAKMRETRSVGVPNYASMVDMGLDSVDAYAFGSAYLGPSTHPFTIVGDPDASNFEIKNVSLRPELAGRLYDRIQLLKSFDKMRRAVDSSGAMDHFNQRAVQILTSDQARIAFDLSRESVAVRDRYGRHAWGQRSLMARRLVEAGVSFITVVLADPYCNLGKPLPQDVVNSWDAHATNGHIFTDMRFKLPLFDQAVTALIEDVYQRGLDKKVMVIVTGEFGRTPRINCANGRPGRDHWPQAMSVLISGGGLRTGQVVGSTNCNGEHPKDRPLVPSDLWATMFRHMGINIDQTFPDLGGRPMPILPDGEAIRELL